MASADLALGSRGATSPTVTLGKTGQVVTRLGMGSSWDVDPSFVQLLLASGITYIDTAEGYEGGKSEQTIGEVLERTGKRKTSTSSPRRKVTGSSRCPRPPRCLRRN